MNMKRRSAFTLIELLVVIAIIAVIAAILFPVFAAAKASAKRTTALSNLDQIGIAAHMYLSDSDDHLPPRFPNAPTWPGYDVILFMVGPGFTQIYKPYTTDSRVWFSPEDRLAIKGFTSFAFNEQLAFSWSMSAIARPAEAIYVTDRTDIPPSPPDAVLDTYAWWQFIDTFPFTESALPGTIDPVAVAVQIDPIRYVGNTGLYLFLDGHAAALQFERTWGDASHNLHLALKP